MGKSAAEWKELILSKEEEIIESMVTAYKDSAKFRLDSFEESVIIDESGEIRIQTLSQNETPVDVWNGEAMQIKSFPWFNVLDCVDEEEKEGFSDDDIREAYISEGLSEIVYNSWDQVFEELENRIQLEY